MIKRMIIAVVILFAVLLLMLPKTDDTSKKKMASAAMLMCSNDYRKAVAEAIRNNDEMDLKFNNECPKLITRLSVEDNGTITLFGAKQGLQIVLTPIVESANIRWSCKGEPEEAITKLCKQ
jgi:hypothetical protein